MILAKDKLELGNDVMFLDETDQSVIHEYLILFLDKNWGVILGNSQRTWDHCFYSGKTFLKQSLIQEEKYYCKILVGYIGLWYH